MLTIKERSAAMTMEELKNLVYTGTDDVKKKARCANALL